MRVTHRASARDRLLLHVVQVPSHAIVRCTVDPATFLIGSLDKKAHDFVNTIF